MFHWLNRLVAVALILTIGAAPLCACPVMNAKAEAPAQAMDHSMECCQESSDRPVKPASPEQACDHCPVMNPTHVTVEKATTIAPPLHWIAWTAPAQLSSLIAFLSERAPTPDESPPLSPRGLFQLRCLLTL